jgi:hypothetical protein
MCAKLPIMVREIDAMRGHSLSAEWGVHPGSVRLGLDNGVKGSAILQACAR